MNPIFYAIVEGPDCAGKTTFVRSLNEKSGWSLNVKDRSYLSTLIYSDLYTRDVQHPEWGLSQEILNLNNVFILLLPPLDVVLERFNNRGDDIQNIHSLKDVYCAFESWAQELELFPNVIVVRDKNPDVAIVWGMIQKIQSMSIKEVANRAKSLIVSRSTSTTSDWEVVGLTFHRILKRDALKLESQDFLQEEEKYYSDIKERFHSKVSQEISRDMMKSSRRFVYTDDSCISMIQCLCRDSHLKFFVHFRSSNTHKILESDLSFIESLMVETLDLYFPECDQIHASYTIGSAHVIV